MVTIGIDPHKQTHSAVATDELGRQLAERTRPAKSDGFGELLVWARELDQERVWGAVVYRLLAGPDAGRSVYVAEGIAPLVRAGEALSAGERIASFTGCIETGWATGEGDGAMAAALGQACSDGDPGCHSTACGVSMSRLIASLGGPPGIMQPGGVYGRDC